MNSEKLLRQYLDTGTNIPHYQYDKLEGNLKKTYLRKRFMVAKTTEYVVMPWEFDDFSEEQKNFLKTYPRYLNYVPEKERSTVIDNFLNNLTIESPQTDIRNVLYNIPNNKYDYVVNKIFDKFGEKIKTTTISTIISVCKKSDDEILEILYHWLNIRNNYIAPVDFQMLGYNDKFNRYIHIKFLKKVLSSPSENWNFYAFDGYFNKLPVNDIYPFFSEIVAKKTVFAGPFMQCYELMSIPNLQDNILRQYISVINTYRLHDLIKQTQEDEKYKNSEEFDPINLIKIFLSSEKRHIQFYELSHLLRVIPENQRDEFNSLVKQYATINENIKRIKELL
jgi:hypothetical protein